LEGYRALPGDVLVPFFVQAEDGIRILIVTGVQTCALPISIAVDRRDDRDFAFGERPEQPPHRDFLVSRHRLEEVREVVAGREVRSEERRVGKERRARRESPPDRGKIRAAEYIPPACRYDDT